MGIPTHQVRTSALRQLVLQAPAPVIARSLDFHDKTTTRIASDAGGPWSRLEQALFGYASRPVRIPIRNPLPLTQGQPPSMVGMTTKPDVIGATGSRESYGGHEERAEKDDRTMRHFTVHHDGVAIPVSRGGRGRPLVLCPGLNSTQAGLHELIGLLRRDHDVVTFGLRGHGLASASDHYSFDALLSDLAAVMAELDLPSEPVLVGYSLGADLAVHYASEHRDSVAGLVLIDGANPVPEPFITETDRAEFRAIWEDLAMQHEADRGTAHQVLLTGQEILDLNVEIDAVRSELLHRYRKIGQPISMIMSTSMAGDSAQGRAPQLNQNWRAGIERLVRERPHVCASWLEADHRLVFTHAPEIARIIRTTHIPADRPTS